MLKKSLVSVITLSLPLVIVACQPMNPVPVVDLHHQQVTVHPIHVRVTLSPALLKEALKGKHGFRTQSVNPGNYTADELTSVEAQFIPLNGNPVYVIKNWDPIQGVDIQANLDPGEYIVQLSFGPSRFIIGALLNLPANSADVTLPITQFSSYCYIVAMQAKHLSILQAGFTNRIPELAAALSGYDASTNSYTNDFRTVSTVGLTTWYGWYPSPGAILPSSGQVSEGTGNVVFRLKDRSGQPLPTRVGLETTVIIPDLLSSIVTGTGDTLTVNNVMLSRFQYPILLRNSILGTVLYYNYLDLQVNGTTQTIDVTFPNDIPPEFTKVGVNLSVRPGEFE